MRMKSGFLAAIILLAGCVLVPSAAVAHPGNTDSSGCHTCRTNCPRWGLDYGEYHCHGGGSSYSAPSYSAPSYVPPPTCSGTFGYMSVDNGDGTCGCVSGYEFGTDFLGKKQCVKSKTCQDIFGYAAVDNGNGTCSCGAGYHFKEDAVGDKSCVPLPTCSDLFGAYAFKGLDGKCDCLAGYQFGYDAFKNVACVKEKSCVDVFGANTVEVSGGKCACVDGYGWNAGRTACVRQDPCVDMINGYYDAQNRQCYCNDGFVWSKERSSCVADAAGLEAQVLADKLLAAVAKSKNPGALDAAVVRVRAAALKERGTKRDVLERVLRILEAKRAR